MRGDVNLFSNGFSQDSEKGFITLRNQENRGLTKFGETYIHPQNKQSYRHYVDYLQECVEIALSEMD